MSANASKTAYLEGMGAILAMLEDYSPEAKLATVVPAIRTFIDTCKEVSQIGERPAKPTKLDLRPTPCAQHGRRYCECDK